ATRRAPCVRGEQSEVAPAMPALESRTLLRPGVTNGSEIAQHSVECSASSAGFARATDSWGRLRRGPPRPPPMERRRWALIIALALGREDAERLGPEPEGQFGALGGPELREG